MNIINRSFWEIIGGKPVILYGMGNGADKIIDYCAAKNIKIDDMFASDEFVRGHSFRGFDVKSLAQIKQIYNNNFCVLLSFAARHDPVINKIYSLADEYEMYVPNFPVFRESNQADIYFDYNYYIKYKQEIYQAYDMLADAESKRVFECVINFNITGKLEYLREIESERESALDLLDLQADLDYIDIGAYDGDTIFEILNYKKDINKIYGLEPDIKNFNKLEKNLRENDLLDRCEIYNLGAWSEPDLLYFNAQANRNSSFRAEIDSAPTKTTRSDVGADSISARERGIRSEVRVDSIDNLLGHKVSGEILIKYDVEGAEFEALTGTREIIKKYSPKLIISLYHKIDDIFRLPVYIKSLNNNYKLYLRKHKYIPCWDLNLYAAAGS